MLIKYHKTPIHQVFFPWIESALVHAKLPHSHIKELVGSMVNNFHPFLTHDN